MNTDNKVRARLARMAMYVDLTKPLITQVMVNRRNQRVKYEFFPTVCFQCGIYGHIKEVCPTKIVNPIPANTTVPTKSLPKKTNLVIDGKSENNANYGPWMLVKKDLDANLGIHLN